MTREQALKQAVKRWGGKALIRANTQLSSPEQREEADIKIKAMRERKVAIDAEIKERLEALDWYQVLTAERKATVEMIQNLQGHQSYFKFNVGKMEYGGFWIVGSGDTWEEAFKNADEKEKK